MVRTVAAWLFLAEATTSMSCNSEENESTSAVGKR